MACQVIIHSWTFCRIVGAFLDLAIAYILLCCSAISYFVSKILGLLGLTLPCPCNGLFGYPASGGPCLQRLLVESPIDTISSVQLSVKTKFPFDAIFARNDHDHDQGDRDRDRCQFNLKLLKERCSGSDDGVLELEGEASYSSFSDPRRSHHTFSGTDSFTNFDDIKAKGTQRSRCGLRRRRRASIDHAKFTSASSYDHFRSHSSAIRRSPSDLIQIENLDNSTAVNICGRTLPDYESNDAADENKVLYENATLIENLKNYEGHWHGVAGEEQNVVRILELALEEEQAARTSLFSELEQERLAAATAADEAMAMISRLQEEKASIEIEARQYQRILEEKSVYDAEEMDILKEIIVRREREKHFLEKELEAYRKVFQVNNGWESQSNDTEQQNEVSLLDPSVDPMLILQHLSQSIDNRENIKNANDYPDYSSAYAQKQTSSVSEGESILPLDHETYIENELESPQCSGIIPDLRTDDEANANQDIQEKGVLSMEEIPYPQLCEPSRSQGQKNNVYLQQKTICDADDGKQMQQQTGEPRVHDVHIIDLTHSICKNTDGNERDPLLLHNHASTAVRKSDLPFWSSDLQKVDGSADSSLKVKSEINRSSSDIAYRFPMTSSSPDRSLVSELRRNSISGADHERLKIDNEIGWLRARLRAVQEEKEKLKSSLEYQERAKTELQLLEDIAAQLREIRHLTGPEKAARQASLPPLSSKVTSKKRRSRSVSVGVGKSESS